ncbi:MAG TPA: hypothetical protein VGM81_14460 [Burkholderiaceae bacterium]|jgi:hypothetical protein
MDGFEPILDFGVQVVGLRLPVSQVLRFRLFGCRLILAPLQIRAVH